jgi:O-acetylserine/cysteine efflux transporter
MPNLAAAKGAFGMKAIDILLAVLVATIWGLGFTLAKFGLGQFPPMLLMALRFTLTAIVLVWFVKPPWRLTGWIFLIALISGTIQYSLTFNGLVRLDASTAVLIIQLEVPFAALLATLFLREHFGWHRFVGLLLAFGGIILIVGEPRATPDLVGVLFVVGGAFTFAAGQVMVRAIGKVGGFTLIAWVAVFTAPQLFVASYLFETDQIEAIRNADIRAWAVIAYLGLVMTAIGYAIWYHLLGVYPVNQVMPFLLLLPVMSVIFSIVLLGESPTLFILGGGALVILGVAITVFERGPGGKRRTHRLSDDAAGAATRAYRAQLEAGADDDAALDAAVMVYRIRQTDVAEDKAREMLTRHLAKSADSS